MDLGLMILLVVAAVALIAVWYYMQQRKSRELQGRFGPEYESTVRQYGDRGKAEADLERRMKRVEHFHIVTLPEADREHYATLWRQNQARFVDDPGGAIVQADGLVNEVMRARGYPMTEFENRAEDLSVDYPQVVRSYRAARAIAERQRHGHADTEDLRRGLVHYRELFDELLEPPRTRQEMQR
jgi:hypothetical protein